ncbi:MAG: outer membrane beta-barrel protein [Gallionella sp.]|jgi:OOP family OmpA-OmpF porin
MCGIKKSLAAALVLASVSGSAMAIDVGQFYVAADVGQAKAKDGCSGLPAGFSCNTNSTGIRLGGGYQITNQLSAELNYADLGTYTINGTLAGLPFTSPNTIKSLQGALVANLPITDSFALTGKLGFASTKVNASASIPGAAVSISATSTTPVLGVGMLYSVNKSLAFRAQYEDFGTVGDVYTGTSKLTLLSVGAVAGF